MGGYFLFGDLFHWIDSAGTQFNMKLVMATVTAMLEPTSLIMAAADKVVLIGLFYSHLLRTFTIFCYTGPQYFSLFTK